MINCDSKKDVKRQKDKELSGKYFFLKVSLLTRMRDFQFISAGSESFFYNR